MARLGRVVAVNVPHHLTQRGNARRFILDCDADRAVYLNLLRENIALYKMSLIGYCLMSNRIHLVAIPGMADGLALALKNTHGRYAAYWNAVHNSSGHAWTPSSFGATLRYHGLSAGSSRLKRRLFRHPTTGAEEQKT